MNYVLITAILFLAQGQPFTADTLRGKTAAITQGQTLIDRRTAIVESLKTAGVNPVIREFTQGARSGGNVIATLPPRRASSSLVLLGAHFDKVNVGQGAVDNAASCAILLELARHLKAQPLENTTVTIAFFDQEETGLLGSAAYFQQLEPNARPSRALNLDIFGYGDTFFAASSREDSPLLATFQQAAAEARFPVRTTPMTQYPTSDHVNMARAGVETLALAIIDGPEIDALGAIGRGGAPPRILTLIHTPNDTIAQLRPQDMVKALPVIERTLRLLDVAPKPQ